MIGIKVAKVINHDHWAGSIGTLNAGPYILRFRTPVLMPKDVSGYIHRLSVVWSYADEDSGEMPEDSVSEEMEVFENRLIEAWERDYNAILTEVLTFDGARQWVFYTKDVNECGNRICDMPQNEEPYPIEMETEDDPEWEYLREDILGRISWEEHQDEWDKSLSSSANNTEQQHLQGPGDKTPPGL